MNDGHHGWTQWKGRIILADDRVSGWDYTSYIALTVSRYIVIFDLLDIKN